MILPGFPRMSMNAPAAPVYVVNGGFDNASGWTLGSGWSISGGVAVASTAITAITRTSNITLVPGTYRFTFTVLNYVSGTVRPIIAGQNGSARSSNGTFVEDIVVSTVSNQLIGVSAISAFDGQIDNITVEKIA
ncbi:hypothetical protein [Qipengyuania sp. MTN3-11]|uniref:hypothetical protein n=1 Tax=Qipengyuania sp. MTN3-11 TaxID=3056557 RepID=UPI0036F1A398